jgi:hypothetical protein
VSVGTYFQAQQNKNCHFEPYFERSHQVCEKGESASYQETTCRTYCQNHIRNHVTITKGCVHIVAFLPFYIKKKYLKAKEEELWKIQYFKTCKTIILKRKK